MTTLIPRSAFRAFAGAVLSTAMLAGCDCGGPGFRDAAPDIEVDPQSFTLEGVPGRFTEHVIKVKNAGSSPLEVESVEAFDDDGDQHVEFAIVQRFVEDCDGVARPEASRDSILPTTCAILRFRYLPKNDGVDSGRIVFKTNDPIDPELTVPINGNAQTPDLQVCAYNGSTELGCSVTGGMLEVDFGISPPGTSVERTLKLKSVGSRPVDISEIALEGDSDFSASPLPYAKVIESGSEDSLSVAFGALAGGPREARLIVRSNDPGEERLTVRLLAIGDGSKLCLCIGSETGRCQPTTIADFGSTPIGGTGHLYMRLASCGTKPLELMTAELTSGAPLFGAGLPTLPRTLQPSDPAIEVPLTFSPVDETPAEGRISIQTTEEQGFITLKGVGYESGCKLESASSVLDFGQVGEGIRAERQYTLANRGDEVCIIKPLPETRISAGADVKFEIAGFPNVTVVTPGSTVRFTIAYIPQDQNGPDEGELTVPFSGEAVGSPVSELKVALKGTPVAEPSCVLSASPGGNSIFGRSLNFGQVRVHTEKVLPVTFTNIGSAPCVISNARIPSGVALPGMPSDAPYFKIKNQPQSPLPPGQSTTVDVGFTPNADRDFGAPLPGFPSTGFIGVSLLVNTQDTVTFDGSACAGIGGTPPPGCVSWSLSGSGAKSDLVALPADVDFGLVTLGCRSREQIVTLYNVGTIALTINEITIDPPTPAGGTPIFAVVAPPTPFTLAGGAQRQISVRYRPPDAGIHTGSIFIKSDATNTNVSNPYITVSMRGEGTTESHQTDVFDQNTRPKSDVLFVIDNSGSMSEEQTALADNAQRFINVATSLNTDFQIGVVSTDSQDKPGELLGSPKIILPGANAASDFARTVRSLGTNGDATEKGLQCMVDALSAPLITDATKNGGFLRTDAKLAVVVVSDEDDYSGGTVDFYTDFLRNLKGIHNQGLVTLSAIVGEDPNGCSTAAAGSRYITVQQRTNGKFRSICSSDWGQIAADLGLDAFGARAGFPLSRVAVPSTIQVKVNGSASTPPAWSYDAASNSVVFTPAALPGPGSEVIIDYEAACL